MRKKLLDPRQPRIVRTEIMAPLRNAVSLIDSDQTHRQIPRPAVDLHQQTLRRNIDDLDAPAEKLLQNVAVLLIGLHRIDSRSRNPV